MTKTPRSSLPRTLRNYVLHKEIGRGGMGVVYQALNRKLKKACAVKVLSPSRVHDAAALARFDREMEVIGKLDHPNIVEALDAGEDDGEHYLVMEFLDGINLTDLVQVNGPLEIADACELLRQAALGLQHAHEHGLVHRDVKPSNLILTRCGGLKLVDLGLARLAERGSGEHSLTGLGEMVGSVDYMAPEQGFLAGSVDIRADLYSLGCSLYKLLTGAAPFSDPQFDSDRRKLAAHAYEPTPKIDGLRPGLPSGLIELIERLMAKSADDRPASPAEVATLLEPFTAGSDLPRLAALYCPPTPSLDEQPKVDGSDPLATTILDHHHQGTTIREDPGDAPSDDGKVVIIDPCGSSLSHRWRRHANAFLRGWNDDKPNSSLAFSLGIAFLGVLALLLAVGLVVWVIKNRDSSPVPTAGSDPLAKPMPGIPYPLLQRRPSPLHSPHDPQAWDLDYKAFERSVKVHSEEAVILSLIATKARRYECKVKIKQVNWTSHVGIVFGWHLVDSGGKPVIRYQTIQTLKDNKTGNFSLDRRTEIIVLPYDSPRNALSTVSPIPTPTLNEEHELAIAIGEHGLESVRWDGNEVPGLADPLKFPSDLTDADYRGEIGLAVTSSDAVFSDASFLLPSEPAKVPAVEPPK